MCDLSQVAHIKEMEKKETYLNLNPYIFESLSYYLYIGQLAFKLRALTHQLRIGFIILQHYLKGRLR